MSTLPPVSFGADIPFVHHLGFELVSYGDGRSELRYAPLPEHCNSFGVTHGGASMTLLDVSLAVAARSVAWDMGVVTIEMKTSFFHPARGRLTGRGHLLHRTRSMAFVEGEILDAQGRVCAHATGTFKYVAKAEDGPAPLRPAISTD
jgi:uncharacterized protein (TIGR00369 family)